MAVVRSLFGRFFGNAVSTAAGYSVGAAIEPTLNPLTQALANETWALHPDIPPDAYVLAAGVAQGQVAEAAAREWAKQTGIGDAQMSALIDIANIGPGEGNARDWLHRGLLDEAAFRRALKRLGWEPEWIEDAWQARQVLLSPAELANARQQGFVDDARQVEEAALQGIDGERAEIQFELAGLPPGPATMQEAVNRGLTDRATFDQAIREGHTKTKYTDLLFALRRPLLSAATYVRLHLKGHISADAMHAGGAQWGYSPGDLDLWYLSEGRPATVHQIHIGYARGASLPGATDEQDAITRAVAESDVRPEYTDLLYASRYSYPSAFVLRSLVQTGAITQDEGEQALLFSGWEPGFAAKVAAAWSGGGAGATADPHVGRAQTQLWSALHRAYIRDEADDATAESTLATLAVPAADQTTILDLWKAERAIVRAELTPKDVKKLYSEATFTQDEAIGRLVQLGYTVADATLYLGE